MSPQLNAGNMRQGLRSLRDLTQHLTTRATTAMHHLLFAREGSPFSRRSETCQTQVRFFALRRINHMLRCLCGPPSIPLSFSLAAVLPGGALIVAPAGRVDTSHTLPIVYGVDYQVLILFAPHASRLSVSTVQQAAFAIGFSRYLRISRYTGIPLPLPTLVRQYRPASQGLALDFHSRLIDRLHALYAQ